MSNPPPPEKKPCDKCGHPIVELKSGTTIFYIEGMGDGDWTPHTGHLCNLHRENGQLRAEVKRYEDRDAPDREPEAWGVRDAENKLFYAAHIKKSAEEFARGYGINAIGSNARVVPLFADAAYRQHVMPSGALRVAFDIGGVLSKRPDVFRPLVAALQAGGVEVFVVTDMPDHEQSVRFVRSNGYAIPAANILHGDYAAHGEACKAETVKKNNLHLLIDDFPGYASAVATETDAVSLFTWPDPRRPYYADDFQTDGKEGDFGRRRPQAPVRDVSKVVAQCEEARTRWLQGEEGSIVGNALRNVLDFLKAEPTVKAPGTIKLDLWGDSVPKMVHYDISSSYPAAMLRDAPPKAPDENSLDHFAPVFPPKPAGWIVQIGEASWAARSIVLARTNKREEAFVHDTEEKALAWAKRYEELKPVVLAVDANGAVIEKPCQDAAVLVPHGVAPRSAISPGTLAAVDEALQKKPEEHRPGNVETILHVCSGHLLEVNKASNGHYLISVRDRGTASAAPAKALICLVPGEARDLRHALGVDEELQKLQDTLYMLRRRIEPLCRDALGPRPVQRKEEALQRILEALQEVR